MADDWVDVQQGPSISAPPKENSGPTMPDGIPMVGTDPNRPSRLERVGRELISPFLGASQLVNHVLPIPGLAAASDKTVKENEAKIQEARGGDKGFNWEQAALDVVNPMNYIGGPVARALGYAPRMVAPIAAAVSGAIQPVTGDWDFDKSKAKQAATGLVAGEVMSRAVPTMTPEARLLVDEGVRLTPGQKAGAAMRRPEEALKSLPVTGHFIRGAEETAREDFNRAAYNRVLDAIGERYPADGPVGNEGVNAVRQRLSDAYDRAIQGTTLRVNPATQLPVGLTAADMQDLTNILGSMTQERRNQFNAIINQRFNQRVPPSGVMTAETFKDVESELQNESRRFTRSTDGDQQHLGEALGEAVDLLRQSHMMQNPEQAAALQAANRGYARYVAVERGARQRLGSDGVMTPQDFLGGLSAMDSSVRRNRFARGVLDMQDLGRAANQTLSSRMADSGTPERQFWKDAAMAMTGIGGAHYAGIPDTDIMQALAALGIASTPYLRGAAGQWTGNIGTRAAQAVDPVLQSMAPGAAAAASLGANQ